MKLFYFFTLIIEALRVESSRMAFNVVRRELIQFVENCVKIVKQTAAEKLQKYGKIFIFISLNELQSFAKVAQTQLRACIPN